MPFGLVVLLCFQWRTGFYFPVQCWILHVLCHLFCWDQALCLQLKREGRRCLTWPEIPFFFLSGAGLLFRGLILPQKSHTAEEAARAQQLLSPSATMECVSGKGPQPRLVHSIPHSPESPAQHTGLFRVSLGDETKISSPYSGLDASLEG